MLLRLGRRVQKELREGDVDLSEVKFKGWDSPDPKEIATGFREPLNRLERSLTGVGSERAESDQSLVDKSRGISGYQRTIRDASRGLGALYRLAGLDELADKILPKRRAPRRSAEPQGEPVSPEEAGAPAEPATDAPAPEGRAPEAPNPERRAAEEAAPGQEAADAGTPAGSGGRTASADNDERNGPIGVVS